MTPEIVDWLTSAKKRFVPYTGKVLEIGSCNINGSARTVFTDAISYLGVDVVVGPCVDLVANAHELDLPDRFDLVLCCEMLEHDPLPLVTAAKIRNHLLPGGIAIITTPAQGFPEHWFPRDYWRFMPNAYTDLFFEGMKLLELVQITGPTLCGIGQKIPK